jgi:hypothetical protein
MKDYEKNATKRADESPNMERARKLQDDLNKAMEQSRKRTEAMKKGNYGKMHYK